MIEIANWMYFNSHFVITISFLAWLYLFRNENFNFVRNMFMVAMGLALVGYALFPTAPPRMFPSAGFTDTIEVFTNMNQDSAVNSVLVNPYAAVPSMHIAFSLMIAVPGDEPRPQHLGASPVVRLPAARLLRDHGHREPLLVRRGRRSRGGLPGGAVGASTRAPAPARLVLAGRGDGRGARLTAEPHRSRPEPAVPSDGAEGDAGVASFRDYARGRLIESRLTPNAISVTGLILNLAAAVLVTQRLFFLAGISFIVGSVMDTLDGRYSRMSGKGTLFGAFLDSTLDRIEEGIVLTAVAWYFADSGNAIAASACVLTVLGSLMVSYTRARAEALGVECKVGIATRPVRVVHSVDRAGVRKGGGSARRGVARPGHLRYGGAHGAHRGAARVARARASSAPWKRCNPRAAGAVVGTPTPPRGGLRTR